jgi:hypothetical protein
MIIETYTRKEFGGETKVIKTDSGNYILSFSFSANNDGGAFSRNRGKASARVEIYFESNDMQDVSEREIFLDTVAGKVEYKNEADKCSRSFIRQHGLRKLLKLWAETSVMPEKLCL